VGQKTEVELFNYLSSATKFNLCISQIVLSEFTYYWLAIEGKKVPVTLKRDSTIPLLVTAHSPINLLSKFTFLEPGHTVIPLYLRYMEKYNLLPNDALIMATCKLSNIDWIASYDGDFESICRDEGIQLIRSVGDIA
jgi:predicted nucleic acid-binding protein